MTEQNKEEILEIDTNQLEEYLSGSELDKLPPIEIDFEDYDAVEFKRGVEETSYVAGKITALFNAGLSESSVLDYLLTTASIKHNKEVAEINKDMNIVISKNHKVVNDKLEL